MQPGLSERHAACNLTELVMHRPGADDHGNPGNTGKRGLRNIHSDAHADCDRYAAVPR
jgi:hypothetical protein